VKNIAVKQPVSQLATVFLLGVALAAGAGTLCFLPAVSAPALSSGCHSAPVPMNPQPAGYQCCTGRHASALLTDVFTPGPVLQARAAEVLRFTEASDSSETFRGIPALSNGHPGALVLRI
jgi:hypothetical protein